MNDLNRIYQNLKQRNPNGDDRALKQQAWVLRDRQFFENLAVSSAAAAAGAGAGAGGGSGLKRRAVLTSEVGDVSLFYQASKFFIYNFETSTQTPITQLSADINNVAPLTDGGFYIKTVDGNGDKVHYLINIDGQILWQDSNLSTEWDDYEAFSKYLVPYYEKNGTYYLVVMDYDGIRQMTFDNFIDGGGGSYDFVHLSGFIAREENGTLFKYLIIPDGSTTPILLKEYDTNNDSINVYQYAYSDKILTITNNTVYEVYDKNAQLLSSLDIDTITSDWSQYGLSYMSHENGSFVFFGYDGVDNNYLVVFYSGVVDAFSYEIIPAANVNYDLDFSDLRDYNSTQNYYHKSLAIMFYNNQDDYSIEGVRYSSDTKLLTIWPTDESLRNFFTFSYETGIYDGYDDTNVSMFRSEDYITTIVDTDINQIYYFTDKSGTPNQISDGGYDMYDDGNRIYADDVQVDYTHTQLQVEKDPGLRASDFISDGVLGTSSVFGASASYFTNLYPGLFVLCAQGTEVNSFNIDGGLGAGGNGTFDNYQYEKEFLGLSPSTSYLVSVKRVWGWPGAGEPISGATEPSVNHIIITKGTTYSGTIQSVGGDTNSDYHLIDNLLADGTSEIYYLLLSLKHGIKISNQQIDDIVTEFLQIRQNSLDINELLTNLNSGYTSITEVLPQGNPTFSVMRFNRTGDTVTYLPTSILKTHNNDDEDRFVYGANLGSIVMQYSEEFYVDSSYGWSDLSDVSSRNYLTLRKSADGNFPDLVSENIELVMKDIVSNQYWAIKFTNWQGGGGGAFAYTRQLIDAGTFSGEIISFTHSSNGDEIDVIVPGVLEITRGEYGPIYNSAVENESNGNNPKGTLWNSIYTSYYERVYHYLFNSEGVEQDMVETYDGYDNEWSGNVYVLSEEIEDITYVINTENPNEFISITGSYPDQEQVYRVGNSGNPGIVFADNGIKYRLFTSDSISSEISPVLSGSYSTKGEDVCERGFVIVKENPQDYVFEFYNLSGNLVASKQLPGNSDDYDYSFYGNRGKRLVVVWWNNITNIRNFIFFNGDSITEFESEFTSDYVTFNDFDWWD